jgi:hypothetical protein
VEPPASKDACIRSRVLGTSARTTPNERGVDGLAGAREADSGRDLDADSGVADRRAAGLAKPPFM